MSHIPVPSESPPTVVSEAIEAFAEGVPVYQGSSTLRIEQKAPNLTDAFRTLSSDSGLLPTEMEELRNVRANLLGVVLNDIDLQRDAAYDSTHAYFRDYEYSTSNH